MILLTDISFFQKPLEIVNINESEAIADSVRHFIRMYEPALLQDVLGQELYNALQVALLVNPLATPFQKLLFGDTYRNNAGRIVTWRGLIEADTSSFSFGASVAAKNPEWLVVGQTVDGNGNIIIPADAASFTMPGWIGWLPQPDRLGAGPMQKDVEFDYNIQTGAFALKAGDSFNDRERLFVEFNQPQTGNTTPTLSFKHSFIADYIYYRWMENNVTFSTGIGEKKVTTSNTTDANASGKMIAAWNDMAYWLADLWNYLDMSKATFTDWYGIGWRELRRYRKINSMGI